MSLVILKELLKLVRGLTKDKKGVFLLFWESPQSAIKT